MGTNKTLIVLIIGGVLCGYSFQFVFQNREMIAAEKSALEKLVELESHTLENFSRESVLKMEKYRYDNKLDANNSPYSPDDLLIDLLKLNRLGIMYGGFAMYEALIFYKEEIPFHDLSNQKDTIAPRGAFDNESAAIVMNYLRYATQIKNKEEMNYDELEQLKECNIAMGCLYSNNYWELYTCCPRIGF